MNTPDADAGKRRTKIITVFVLVALLAGGVAFTVWWDLDKPAKYILRFGDQWHPNRRVFVTNIDTFEKALGYQNNTVHAPNWSSLTKVLALGEKAKQVETATPSPAGPGTVTISHISVTQETTTIGDKKPNTMHVTQKLGLDNMQQVKDVLATLSLNQDP